jgi:8-oxo-dGTP diphosphatase
MRDDPQPQPRPLRLVVDAANVVGSRPDGWWRDRAGAAARLRDELVGLARRGIPSSELPTGGDADDDVVYPDVVLVVEGKARPVADAEPGHPAVHVVAAPHEGDDEIVAQAARPGAPVLVVTADRDLRERVSSEGAGVTGPGWLFDLLGR